MAAGGGSSKRYFEETWFELFFLLGCFVVAYGLFSFLTPPVNMNPDTIEAVAMGKLFADLRPIEAFTRFAIPPGYPLLMALVIIIQDTTELPRLIAGFQQLNLFLYLSSIVLFYFFIRRQIRKPYTFIITALYTLAPSSLDLAWQIGPDMAYMAISMAALFAIDWRLSKEHAEEGKISRGELLLMGLLIGLSILAHPMGYVLLLAFFFVMIKRFGLKRSALVLAITLLALSPFVGRDIFNALRAPQAYVASSSAIVQTAQKRGVVKTVKQYADQFMLNLTQPAVGELDLAALGQKSRHLTLAGHPWGRWILGMLIIMGSLYGLYQYTGISSLYLTAYTLTAILLLPTTGISLAPVLPLVLFYLYFGVMRLGEWAKRIHLPLSRVLAPALTVWILLCTGSAYLGQTAFSQADNPERTPRVVYMSTAKAPQNRLEKAQKNSAHHRAMDWLSAHTPANAKVAIPRPEAASLMASEARQEKLSASERQALQKELGQYDYLVEENAGPISSLRRTRGAVTSGHGMKLVYEDVPGRIRIWQVQPALQ